MFINVFKVVVIGNQVVQYSDKLIILVGLFVDLKIKV